MKEGMKEEESLLLGGDLAFSVHDQAGILGGPLLLVFADERTEA